MGSAGLLLAKAQLKVQQEIREELRENNRLLTELLHKIGSPEGREG
jgi:hypothetical protein